MYNNIICGHPIIATFSSKSILIPIWRIAALEISRSNYTDMFIKNIKSFLGVGLRRGQEGE